MHIRAFILALFIPIALSAQTPDSTALLVPGDVARLRSPESLLMALRWERGITVAESGTLHYRIGLLRGDRILVDGLPFGERIDRIGGGLFVPTRSLLSLESAVLTSHAGVLRSGAGDGVLELRMRRGDTSRFRGGASMRIDVAPLFGSSDELRVSNALTKRDTTLAPLRAAAEENRLYELFVEGPVASLPATVHLSAKYNPISYFGATYDLFDVDQAFVDAHRDDAAAAGHAQLAPTNLGQLPRSSAMQWDLFGNVAIAPMPALEIVLSGEKGLARRDIGSWSTLFMLDDSSGVLERDAQGVSTSVDVGRLQARVDYRFDESSTLRLDLARQWTSEREGKRDPREHGALEQFDIYGPDDLDANRIIDRYADPMRVVALNQYLPPTARTQVHARNPLTGRYEGAHGGAGKSPYGMTTFPAHGNARVLAKRESIETHVRLAYRTADSIFGVAATIDAGFDGSFFELRSYENSQPWTVNPLIDVHGYESTMWSSDSVLRPLAGVIAEPQMPSSSGAFARSTWQWGELSATAGVRLDIFDAGGYVLTARDRQSNESIIAALVEPTSSTTKLDLNPELVIGYRPAGIGEFSIGLTSWTTVPDAEQLFSHAYTSAARGMVLVGNPDLAPARSRRFSITGALDLGASTRLRAEVYRQSATGEVGTTLVTGVSPFLQYDDRAESDRIGGELGIDARLGEHLLLAASWHIGRATYRHPSVRDAGGTDDLLDASDRTHAANLALTLDFGAGEGPEIGGLSVLENLALFVAAGYRSGSVRHSTDAGSTVAMQSHRMPERWLSAASLIRTIPLAEIFGDGLGTTAIELALDVDNLLNRTGAIDSYVNRFGAPVSPTSDDETMSGPVGLSATPLYREIDPSRPETYSTMQYDAYGERRYNAYLDADRDGIETQEERAIGYQRWITTLQAQRENFELPRRVFLRIGLRF